jgi:hypothetical protein
MIRTIGFVGILAALGIWGMTWARESFQATEKAKAPSAILGAAAVVLDANHRTNGTYAGSMPDTVTVVSADSRSFCIEHGGYFLAGPGGTPTPGSCRR